MGKRRAREVWEYDSMEDFEADGGTINYGVGWLTINDNQYFCNGNNLFDSSGKLAIGQLNNGYLNTVLNNDGDLSSFYLSGFKFNFIYDNNLPRISSIDLFATGKFLYINPTGLDSRSYAQAQISDTAWATPYKFRVSALAGDGAYIKSGTYVADGSAAYGTNTYHAIGARAMNWFGDENTVLKNTAVSNPLMFIDTPLPNGAVSRFYKLTLDGENKIQTLLGNTDMGGSAWNFTFDACTFKDPLNYAVLLSPLKIGTFTFNGCIFSGSPSAAGFAMSTNGLAVSGQVVVNLFNPEINLKRIGTVFGINQPVPGTALSNFAFNITGGQYEITSYGTTGFACGILVETPATPISGLSMVINADSANSNSCYGLFHRSGNAANIIADAHFFDCQLKFNAPSGYAAALGTQGGFAITGVVERLIIEGIFYLSATPHGIALQDNAIGIARFNNVSNTYAGILASKTGVGAQVVNNLTVDCYGADIYAKGVQNALLINANVSVITGKNSRRNLGVLSVDSQGGVISTAVTLSNNIVVVGTEDLTIINKLVNISVNNSCSYSNNIYILPDSIPDSAALFSVGSGEGGGSAGTNYSIDQWRTGTAGSIAAANGTGVISVSGERIIKLPISRIQQIIKNLNVPTVNKPLLLT